MTEVRIYEFLNSRDEGVIVLWLNQARIQKQDRARLDEKMRRLRQIGFELATKTKLLQGPIYKQIYKLKIHGQVMLRPMLCRGPFNNDTEFTFLLGAVEINFRLPTGSREQAEANRLTLLSNSSKRRLVNERFI